VASWSGVLVVVAAFAVATGAGTLLKRRSGNFRTVPLASSAEQSGSRDPGARAEGAPVRPVAATLAGLGVDPGPVTLLQFSSAFCAPCRTTRVLCADVAAAMPGVRHVEVDAESHLDAVRALKVWKTPTVLIVDGEGQIRRRATGAPTRSQLAAAIAEVLG